MDARGVESRSPALLKGAIGLKVLSTPAVWPDDWPAGSSVKFDGIGRRGGVRGCGFGSESLGFLRSTPLPSLIVFCGDCGGVTGSSSFSSSGTAGGGENTDGALEVLSDIVLSPLLLSLSPLDVVRRRLTTRFFLFRDACALE